MYASIADMRNFTGLTATQVSTTVASALVPIADRWVFDNLAIHIHDEELIGKIDSSNKEFKATNTPLADKNLDGSFDENDFLAYEVAEDDENNRVYTDASVSTVTPRTGVVILTNAPTTAVDVGIYADYYTWPPEVAAATAVVADAASWYLGYLCVIAKAGKLPTKQTLDKFSYQREEVPGKVFQDQAFDMINDLSPPILVADWAGV